MTSNFEGNSVRADRVTLRWVPAEEPQQEFNFGFIAWADALDDVDTDEIWSELAKAHSVRRAPTDGEGVLTPIPANYVVSQNQTHFNWGASADTIIFEIVSNLDVVGYAVASNLVTDLLKKIVKKLRSGKSDDETAAIEPAHSNSGKTAISAVRTFYALHEQNFTVLESTSDHSNEVIFIQDESGRKFRVQIVMNSSGGVVCRIDTD